MSGSIPTSETRNIYIDKDNVRVIGMKSSEAEDILDALSSETTRQIFLDLYETPSTISELSENSDDSIQNTKYHLQKLEDTGIIEKVGEQYSKKGNEMDVYGSSNDGIIFVVDDENRDTKETLKRAIKNFSVPILSMTILSTIGYFLTEKYNNYKIQKLDSSKDVGIESQPNIEATRDTSMTTLDSLFKIFESNPEVAIVLLIIISSLVSILAYILSEKYI